MTTLDHQLNTLESSGLIRLARAQPELEYMFRHALVQEATYQSLLKSNRHALHLAVGEALEQLYPQQLEQLAPVLARHFLEAGDEQRALKYFMLAGDVASHRYANAEAVMNYTHALAVAKQHVPATLHVLRARALAHETLGQFELARSDHEAALSLARTAHVRQAEWQALLDLGFLWAGRDYTQTGNYYRQAYEVAREMDEPPILAHTLNRLGNWQINIEHPLEALRYHQEALAIFEQMNDSHGLAETLDLLGMASTLGGDAVKGAAYLDQAIALFRKLDDRQGLASSLTVRSIRGPSSFVNLIVPASMYPADGLPDAEQALQLSREIGWRSGEAFALLTLGVLVFSLGDYDHGLGYARAAYKLTLEIGHQQWMTFAHVLIGTIYLDLLAVDDALPYLEEGLALAHQIGSLYWVRVATSSLVSAYLVQRNIERAEAILQPALPADSRMQSLALRLTWYARAELVLAQNKPDLALQIADDLIASAVKLEQGAVGSIPLLGKLRGEALAQLQRVAEAEAALQAARDGATAQGVRPIRWRILVTLGKVYRQANRSAEAENAFASARATIAELATHISDERLRENFLRQAHALMSAYRS